MPDVIHNLGRVLKVTLKDLLFHFNLSNFGVFFTFLIVGYHANFQPNGHVLLRDYAIGDYAQVSFQASYSVLFECINSSK